MATSPRIFVSHSHADNAFTEKLVEDLRHAQTQVWLDENDLGAGDFQARISTALGNCEWFVLVLTKDALDSQWVRQEVNAANRLRHQGRIHNLIFIRAGLVEERDIPPLWGVYNIFDATVNYAAALASVLKAVGVLSLNTAGQPVQRKSPSLQKANTNIRNQQPAQHISSPNQLQRSATPKPSSEPHIYDWKTLAALTLCYILPFILAGADGSSTSSPTTSTSPGVVGTIGTLLFLITPIVVTAVDWRGFTTLNGHIHWYRMTGGQRFWMGCLYLFMFEIILFVYLVMEWRVCWQQAHL